MPHTEGAESRRREASPHRGSETPIRGCPAPRPPFDTGTAASLRCPDLVSASALRSSHLRHPHPDRPPASATHPPHLRHPHSSRRALCVRIPTSFGTRAPTAGRPHRARIVKAAKSRCQKRRDAHVARNRRSRQRAGISASPGFCQGYGAGAAEAASEPGAPRRQSAG